MREAVIVSTARTGIGKAYRGALNATKSPTLVGHVLDHAIERAGIEAGEIEDFVLGTVLAAGTAGMNLARNAVFAAGAPVSVSGPDHRSPVRVGPDGDRDGGKADRRGRHGCRRGRRAGEHFRRAGPLLHLDRGRGRPQRRRQDASRLHADAQDSRVRGREIRCQPRGAGRICAAVAAANRGRPAGRPVRRRDRAVQHHHAGEGQGHGRCLASIRSRSTATRATGRRRRWKTLPA